MPYSSGIAIPAVVRSQATGLALIVWEAADLGDATRCRLYRGKHGIPRTSYELLQTIDPGELDIDYLYSDNVPYGDYSYYIRGYKSGYWQDRQDCIAVQPPQIIAAPLANNEPYGPQYDVLTIIGELHNGIPSDLIAELEITKQGSVDFSTGNSVIQTVKRLHTNYGYTVDAVLINAKNPA